MSWVLFVLFLCLPFSSLSEGRLVKKLPSATIVGAVYCNTCYQQDSKNSHFISGSSSKLPSGVLEVFKPAFNYKQTRSEDQSLHCAFDKHQPSLLLSSLNNFIFTPTSIKNTRRTHILSWDLLFQTKPSARSFTKQSFIPNPLQPSLPVPNPLQPTLPVPNPLQPPPLIPNPLQPPPLVPNPLQPPPAPLLPLPPLPGLTPPPPPPSLPLPFPQLPLPPVPRFPGVPPSRPANENLP